MELFDSKKSITFVITSGRFEFYSQQSFSASNSPSRYEFAVAREFFQELGSPFHVVVAMKAADEGSLLRPGYIDKALEIEDYLQYKLKVTHENRSYSYSDFCGTQCETSDAVRAILEEFILKFR